MCPRSPKSSQEAAVPIQKAKCFCINPPLRWVPITKSLNLHVARRKALCLAIVVTRPKFPLLRCPICRPSGILQPLIVHPRTESGFNIFGNKPLPFQNNPNISKAHLRQTSRATHISSNFAMTSLLAKSVLRNSADFLHAQQLGCSSCMVRAQS